MFDSILTPEQIDTYAPGVLRYRQHGEQRTYDRHVSLADVLVSHEALRAECDEAHARIAELEAEVKRLRRVVDVARTFLRGATWPIVSGEPFAAAGSWKRLRSTVESFDAVTWLESV